MEITIQDVDDLPGMRVIEDLQKEVWGVDDRDIVPHTQMAAALEVGGCLIGAFYGRKMVGFVYGFLGLEHERLVMHSHMAAVLSAYRSYGVGYQLKLAQRERALAKGITRITWTYDPLQALNAHFNFNKLGVVSDRYLIDFYGEATSSFLHQLGTDRLLASWRLDRDRINPPASSVPLLSSGADGRPRWHEETRASKQESLSIQIPHDIGQLQQQHLQLALEWRQATRSAFTQSLAAGFTVLSFDRATSAYTLGRIYD
jgi:chorismate synthase